MATEAKKKKSKKDKKERKKLGPVAVTHTPHEQGPTSHSEDYMEAPSEVGTDRTHQDGTVQMERYLSSAWAYQSVADAGGRAVGGRGPGAGASR